MERPLKFEYKDAGAIFLWAILGLQAGGLIYSVLPESLSGNLLLTGAFNNLILLAVYFCYTRVVAVRPLAAARVTSKFPPTALIAAVLAAPVLQYAMNGAMTLFDMGLRAGGYESVNGLVAVDFLEYGAGGLIGYILISGVMTGICEELVFRGGLLQSLRARFGETAAVLLSAFCFMIFHTSPDQTIFQFALGIVLALLTIRSSSLIPAIALHAANNILSVFFAAYGVSYPMPASVGGLVAVALAGVVIVFPLLTIGVDALCGKFRDNRIVVWLCRLVALKKKKAAVCEEKPEEKTPVQTAAVLEEEDEEGAIFDVAVQRNRERSQRRYGTILLTLGVVVCSALWIVQLVMGFVGGAAS